MLDRIKEYREKEAVHYSLLSSLAKDPKEAKLMLDGVKSKPTLAQIEGSVLDTLCFDRENFFNEFYIIEIKPPEDKLLKVAEACIEAKSLDPDFVLNRVRTFEYQGNWKDDTIKAKVPDMIKEYVEAYLEAGDKTIISKETYTTFSYAAEVLQKHPFTNKYFKEVNTPELEIKFQVPVYWGETIQSKDLSFSKKVTFKGLVDIQVINHAMKTVLNIDLKKNSTGGGDNSFYTWKYYIQASMYYTGAYYNLPNGYSMVNPLYIYLNTFDIDRPRLFEVSQNTLKAGMLGGWFNTGSEYKKGYYDLVQELYWHKENNLWEYSKEEYKNNGIKITDKLITINPFK